MKFLIKPHVLRRPAVYALALVLVLVAAIGILLRLHHYRFSGSLWLDEAALAMGFAGQNAVSLITKHLPFYQSAPPAFILLTHSITSMFGSSDLHFRAFPLFSGIVTVILAALVALREFRHFVGIVAFAALVAVSPVLIYYSSEFKPYASDALVALLILAVIGRWERPNRAVIVGSVGLLSVLVSLPSVFILAPAWVFLLVRSRQLSTYRNLAIVTAMWGVGALLHGAYLVTAGTDTEFMRNYWVRFDVFAPLPPKSLGDFYWYVKSVWELAYVSLFEDGVAGPGLRGKEAGQWEWVVAGVIAIAAIESVRLRRPLAIVAVSAILLTCLVSASFVYPFSSRLLVFLVPLVLFVVAQFIDDLARRGSGIVTWALVVALLCVPVATSYAYVLKPYPHTDFEKVVSVLNKNVGPNDVVAVSTWTWRIHQFYRAQLKIEDSRIHRIVMTDDTQLRRILKEQNVHRIWLVESHRLVEADKFTKTITSLCSVDGPRPRLRSRVYVLDCPPPSEASP
jgi:hypothetical protein